MCEIDRFSLYGYNKRIELNESIRVRAVAVITVDHPHTNKLYFSVHVLKRFSRLEDKIAMDLS